MSDRVRILLGAAVLLAVVFAAYAPSLRGGFIWDDDANVSANPTIRTGKGLQYIWTKPEANQQFYPLTYTSFWVEYRLWELAPAGYRATNLVLHALVALLIWVGLRRLAVPGAWVAAAVFALHPVHVETAAWITERKNLLSAVFYLAALLCWLRFSGVGSGSAPGDRRPGGRRLAYAGALFFFLCGLLSKTAVLTLPAALLVIGWWKRGRLGRADVISVVPMFAIGTVFGVVTLWLERQHVGAAGPEWDLGLAERIIVAGRAVWFYATQLVLPFRLNFIYPRWAVDATAVWQWVYPLAALALPVLLWRRRARLGRGPLAGVLFYGITLAPALGLLGFYFQLYSFVQDHHQYLASAGLIGLITGVAAAGLRRWHARAAVAAAALVLCVLGALTWVRSGHFTSEAALWESVLARNPGAWMAEINLGLVRQREGKLVEAEERFRRALAIEHPEHAKAHTNLGAVLEARGDFEGAGEQYAAALEKDPDYPEAHFNLGSLLAGGDREDQAIAHFRAAVEAEPRFVQARYALALLLAERGGEFEAERHLREAIRLNPGYVDAVDALARILGPQGRREEAVELYRRVLLFDPTRAEVHYNLGFNLEQLEDLEGAERHYRAAIELQPDLAGAHNNLAIVLYRTGRYAEAWQEVIRYRELGGRPHRDFLRALADAMPPPE